MIVLTVTTPGGVRTFHEPQDAQADGGVLLVVDASGNRTLYSPMGWLSAVMSEEKAE